MNKEMRRKDRDVLDHDQIITIINHAKILHLGLIDHEFPYIVPLHYGYEYDSNKDMFIFYMHGARAGHKIDLLKNNSNVCIELETDIELDGADDIPCQYGSFYSSVMGWGCASIIDDVEEKKRALNLLMENQIGKAFEFTEKMVAEVAVIKVEIREYTAKARIKLKD